MIRKEKMSRLQMIRKKEEDIMSKFLGLFLLLSIGPLLFFVGCNDSPATSPIGSADPVGTWSVRFTELLDECDKIAPDDEGVGFTSQQTVTRNGDTYSVEADELVFGFIDGALRASDSLEAEDSFTGDLFGTGISCVLSERLAYNNITETSTDIVYEVVIACEDGTRCDSLFRAYGERSS